MLYEVITLLAVNKADLGREGGLCPEGGIRISARTGLGIDRLLERMERELCLRSA